MWIESAKVNWKSMCKDAAGQKWIESVKSLLKMLEWCGRMQVKCTKVNERHCLMSENDNWMFHSE